jgi:Asp-tRNA(Asn)/Glu-tRNA(Gln) amidotransferase A subunit family amidase
VPLSFSRDRGGPLCRTVEDTAVMLEVVTGYDPRDHITSATYGKKPIAYRNYANKKSLAGKRLGVVREFMVEATLADRDSIRVANEAIAEMKKLGATIVDPVNVQAVIADLVPYLEPSILTQSFPSSTPSGAKPIDQAVLIAADPKLLPGGPRGVNLRMLAAQRRGEEARYALNRYLRERGDAKFKSVEDLFATPTFLGDSEILKAAFGETAKTIDTPAHTNHTLRIQTLQKILYKVMADNKLDALVYVYSTIPPNIILASRQAATYNAGTEPRLLKAGTELSDPNFLPGEQILKTDLDLYRGAGGSWAVNLSPVSGFPAIVVPAGFSKEVYDRVSDAKDPNGSTLVGPKPDRLPVAMEFLGRPFEEATLFEIASAYEAGTKHRRAPKGFGPLKGEP